MNMNDVGPWIFRTPQGSGKQFESVYLVFYPSTERVTVVVGSRLVEALAVAWEILPNTNPKAVQLILEKNRPFFEAMGKNWHISSETQKIALNPAGMDSYRKVEKFIKNLELSAKRATDLFARIEMIDTQAEWKRMMHEKNGTPAMYPLDGFKEVLREYGQTHNTRFVDLGGR